MASAVYEPVAQRELYVLNSETPDDVYEAPQSKQQTHYRAQPSRSYSSNRARANGNMESYRPASYSGSEGIVQMKGSGNNSYGNYSSGYPSNETTWPQSLQAGGGHQRSRSQGGDARSKCTWPTTMKNTGPANGYGISIKSSKSRQDQDFQSQQIYQDVEQRSVPTQSHRRLLNSAGLPALTPDQRRALNEGPNRRPLTTMHYTVVTSRDKQRPRQQAQRIQQVPQPQQVVQLVRESAPVERPQTIHYHVVNTSNCSDNKAAAAAAVALAPSQEQYTERRQPEAYRRSTSEQEERPGVATQELQQPLEVIMDNSSARYTAESNETGRRYTGDFDNRSNLSNENGYIDEVRGDDKEYAREFDEREEDDIVSKDKEEVYEDAQSHDGSRMDDTQNRNRNQTYEQYASERLNPPHTTSERDTNRLHSQQNRSNGQQGQLYVVEDSFNGPQQQNSDSQQYSNQSMYGSEGLKTDPQQRNPVKRLDYSGKTAATQAAFLAPSTAPPEAGKAANQLNINKQSNRSSMPTTLREAKPEKSFTKRLLSGSDSRRNQQQQQQQQQPKQIQVITRQPAKQPIQVIRPQQIQQENQQQQEYVVEKIVYREPPTEVHYTLREVPQKQVKQRPRTSPAAEEARRFVKENSIATIATIHQDGYFRGRPSAQAEYYADVGAADGSLLFISPGLSIPFGNIAHGSPATITIRAGDSPNARTPRDVAASPCIILYGSFTRVEPDRDVISEYLRLHPDAQMWRPGSKEIPGSEWVAFGIDGIYYISGYGGVGHVGALPVEDYLAARIDRSSSNRTSGGANSGSNFLSNFTNGRSNGQNSAQAEGYADDRRNGYTNGHSNGYTNGHSNGYRNGYGNEDGDISGYDNYNEKPSLFERVKNKLQPSRY